MSDGKLISRAFYTIVKSYAFGVLSAFLATILFAGHFSEITPEVLSRAEPTLPYVIVAIIAGLAGSFALVKPKLSETLPGIAISVALIPPIAVTGIGLAKLNINLITGSILFFMVNLIGIVFASMITFSMMNFYVKRSVAHRKAEEEDKKVKDEVKKAQEQKNHGS